jgi:hypothetical protein
MSSVFFEGNTYTFGATVSANPGTGTTSYVFGGLSSGATFGFILRAFNGFGFSNFVGPVTKITLSQNLEEDRPIIASLDWSTPYSPISVYYRYLDPTPINNTNIFVSSSNLTPVGAGGTWWLLPGNVPFNSGWSISTGFTAPDGSTTAWRLFAGTTSSGGWNINQTVALEIGKTYYISYYVNLSEGDTGTIFYPGMYWDGTNVNIPFGVQTVNRQQILPVLGAMTTSGGYAASKGSATGWTRFAWQFYTLYDLDTRLNISILDVPQTGKPRYYWGPQLEQDN